MPGHTAGVRLADMDDPAAELAAYFQARTPVPDEELIRLTSAARGAGQRREQAARTSRPPAPALMRGLACA